MHLPRVLKTFPVALLAACLEPAGPTPGAVVAIAIDSSAGPLTRIAVVTVDRPAPVDLTWGTPGARQLVITSDSLATTHRVILPRLRAGTDYAVEAAVHRGTTAPQAATFTTGPLPADVAAIVLDVSGVPSVPVALIEIAGSTAFSGLLIVEDGRIVGYERTTGSLFGMTRRANGDFVLLDGTRGLVIRRLDGSEVGRLEQASAATPYGTIHHDVIATPSNTLLFIANETRSVAGETVVGESLWEWSPEAGTVARRWSAFDHLDWATERGRRSGPGNWLHGNGIAYGPRGNVLMSLRNVDQVISIAPDFSRVEWSLGGVNGTLSVADADRFFGQHYVTEPQADRVLVFDNGFERPGGAFSRGIEFALDRSRRTATRVWEYRHSPDIYAALVGSARRLPNGNTTLLFGMLAGQNGSTGPLTALEVTPTGAVRWRLTVGPQLTRLYRVTPVESVLGEREAAARP